MIKKCYIIWNFINFSWFFLKLLKFPKPKKTSKGPATSKPKRPSGNKAKKPSKRRKWKRPWTNQNNHKQNMNQVNVPKLVKFFFLESWSLDVENFDNCRLQCFENQQEEIMNVIISLAGFEERRFYKWTTVNFFLDEDHLMLETR